MTTASISFYYLIAALCFILSLRGLSSPKTAVKGNIAGITGMLIALSATLTLPQISNTPVLLSFILVGAIIGLIIAKRIAMTALPQLIAGFHSLIGLAAVLIAGAAFLSPAGYGIGVAGQLPAYALAEMAIGAAIGAITFTGSLTAFAKLQGILSSKPVRFKAFNLLNPALTLLIVALIVAFTTSESGLLLCAIVICSLLSGVLLILPIGGADMPVVISTLNSFSGWAAAGIGFTLHNSLLVITGALVGSSGAILSHIMCKAMNRSLFGVFFGKHAERLDAPVVSDEKAAHIGTPADAAKLFKKAKKAVIVPGYGMAVARAQFSLEEMAELLQKKGIDVKYAVHPVAGRMPGHMNVLLAEAKIPYEDVRELEEINDAFADTDVVYVIGANDVVNPLAKTDKDSPIYGMPVLDVEKARHVIVVKRSLNGFGYAGIENPLFYAQNTTMLLGDAKQVTQEIADTLKADS